jgi:hypothetical protein
VFVTISSLLLHHDGQLLEDLQALKKGKTLFLLRMNNMGTFVTWDALDGILEICRPARGFIAISQVYFLIET